MIFDVFDRLMDILNARNKSFSLTKKFFPAEFILSGSKNPLLRLHICGNCENFENSPSANRYKSPQNVNRELYSGEKLSPLK